MPRTHNAVATKKRHKKIFKRVKGHYGRRKNCITVANQSAEKAGQYAYRDRKVKKRTFRSLWIARINAGVREHGMIYSQFVAGLKKANIDMDRKVLSDLAIREPAAFKQIVEQAKAALGK